MQRRPDNFVVEVEGRGGGVGAGRVQAHLEGAICQTLELLQVIGEQQEILRLEGMLQYLRERGGTYRSL